MPPDYAPRHPYLKLAFVSNPQQHGTEIPNGPERNFLVAKANSITRGSATLNGSFPVHQPRSFRRHQLDGIAQNKYLVSLKTDGVRYLLLLTRYNSEPRAVLIDRSMCVREIEVWANDDYFDDTLLDGELVTERNVNDEISDAFLAFDMFSCRGRSLAACVYSDRLSELFGVLLTVSDDVEGVEDVTNVVVDSRKICAAPDTNLRIVAKVVMSAAYTEHIWIERRHSRHLNDGLIFTPDVDRNSADVVFKWKPLSTIDVMLRVTRDRPPSILIRHSNKTRGTSVVDMGEGLKLRLVLESNVLLESLVEQGHVCFVVECACFIKGRIAFITPIRPRLDKDSPNHIHVVKETLYNVIERMDVHEIAKALGSEAPFVPSSPTYCDDDDY